MILLHQLIPQQLKELDQLLASCKKTDKHVPNVYPYILEQFRPLPVTHLIYEDGELCAFLSLYFFQEDCCEVSVCVSPKHRRKGLAKQMLHSVLNMILDDSIEFLLFPCPHKQHDEWLKKRGFTYTHTEYHMVYDAAQGLSSLESSLDCRTAKLEDIDELCNIDACCFQNVQTTSLIRYETLIDDPNYTLFVAFLNEKPIGKAHIRWREHEAILSDIGILPSHQGQGFGTQLIHFCIKTALSRQFPLIGLDVELKNQKALNLYTRIGFRVDNACDFWKIPKEVCLKMLNLSS